MTKKELIIGVRGDTSDFEKKLDQMSAKMKDVGKQMQDIGKSMTQYVTLPIVAAGTASFVAAKDFEASMSKITGLVGVASDQVEQWKDDLIRLGPQLGRTPNELADALFFVTSAGLRGAEALDVLKMSAKASVAGLGETKTIADLVTSAINAYGAANLSASRATDILVASVREGKAEATELAASMGQVLPIAAELGVSFDQVGGAMAAMTRTGTNAATAATQLRAIMAGLMKPSKQAADTLAEMGTSASELRRQIREEGLLSTLMTVRELTNKFGEDAMSIVFPNIRALAGVLDLMGSNLDENVKSMNAVTNSAGSLEAAFEEASGTAQFKWDQAMASANATLIVLGDTVKIAVIPLLERFSKAMNALADWFKGLEPETRKLVVAFGGLAAAIGPVMVVLGTFVSTILPKLITGLKVLRTVGLGPLGVAIGGLYGLWKLFNFEQEKTKRLAGDLATKSLPELEKMAGEVSDKLSEALGGAGVREGLGMALSGIGATNPFAKIIDQARKALGGNTQTEALIQQGTAIQQAIDLVKERTAEEEKLTGEIEAQVKAMLGGVDSPGTGSGPLPPAPEMPESILNEDSLLMLSSAHDKAKQAALDQIDATFGLNEAYAALDETIAENAEGWDRVAEKMEYQWELMDGLKNASLSFGDAIMAVGIQGSDSLKDFGKTVKRIAKQSIAAMIAESVAAAVKSALISIPFPFNIAAAGAAGGLAAALFNAIPGFADGGVVPPGYPNDSYLARLTSGERIIPAGQSTNQGGGEVRFEIEYDKLIGILRRGNTTNLYT